MEKGNALEGRTAHCTPGVRSARMERRSQVEINADLVHGQQLNFNQVNSALRNNCRIDDRISKEHTDALLRMSAESELICVL